MHPKALSRDDLISLGQFITVKSCDLLFKKLSLTLSDYSMKLCCYACCTFEQSAMVLKKSPLHHWIWYFSWEEKRRIILWFKFEVSFNFFENKLLDFFLIIIKKDRIEGKFIFCIVLSTKSKHSLFWVSRLVTE